MNNDTESDMCARTKTWNSYKRPPECWGRADVPRAQKQSPSKGQKNIPDLSQQYFKDSSVQSTVPYRLFAKECPN